MTEQMIKWELFKDKSQRLEVFCLQRLSITWYSNVKTDKDRISRLTVQYYNYAKPLALKELSKGERICYIIQ